MTIIAIDGPSGSGKSTIARLIAERLNLPYLDTGAMYRAVALVALRKGIAFEDAAGILKCAAELKLQLLDERVEGKLVPRVIVSGVDATTEIRTPEVTQGSSAIAVHPEVHERLVRRQRNWVTERGSAAVEGRDIGTVVFPDADLKVFLTASSEERARRRQADEHAPAFAEMSSAKAATELESRDTRDSTREASPLKPADDSYVIDTTGRDIEDVLTEIFIELRKRSNGELPTGKS